jgi:adenylate kinase family enzyme
VAVLAWWHALPAQPCRVLVAGPSGSGKSTVARAVSAILELPYTELDSLFHGPEWVPRQSFVDEVRALAAQPRWVSEWQYRQVRELLMARADLVVWLDLPQWRVGTQLVWRTVRRAVRREELWNGNVEPPLHTILTDPEHILRWWWGAYRRGVRRMRELVAVPEGSRPTVVRLRSRREVREWLAGPLAAASR